MKLDLLNLWHQHNITPRGIISVGGCDRNVILIEKLGRNP